MTADARRTYRLEVEPVGVRYRPLLRQGAAVCDTFLLVRTLWTAPSEGAELRLTPKEERDLRRSIPSLALSEDKTA